jgi:hypothetical protein
MSSLARRGIDMLLAEYPDADVQSIEDRGTHAWTTVDLVHFPKPGSLSAVATFTRYAVWNHTGNVYRIDRRGAVVDDPFLVVTPL